MASNKRSARAKQRAAFEAGFDGNAMGDLFTREREHDAESPPVGAAAERVAAGQLEAMGPEHACHH